MSESALLADIARASSCGMRSLDFVLAVVMRIVDHKRGVGRSWNPKAVDLESAKNVRSCRYKGASELTGIEADSKLNERVPG